MCVCMRVNDVEIEWGEREKEVKQPPQVDNMLKQDQWRTLITK